MLWDFYFSGIQQGWGGCCFGVGCCWFCLFVFVSLGGVVLFNKGS